MEKLYEIIEGGGVCFIRKELLGLMLIYLLIGRCAWTWEEDEMTPPAFGTQC